MQERPVSVPAEAVWDDGDKEWVLAEVDEDGRKHGVVTYWRPDGTLVNCCAYEHGVPHGSSTRYHESGEVSRSCTFVNGVMHGVDAVFRSTGPTTELAFPVHRMPDTVWRYEAQKVHGQITGVRLFDREGHEVTETGQPYPERPQNVPGGAVYRSKDEMWLDGVRDSDGRPRGLWWSWNREGVPSRLSYHRAGNEVALFPSGVAKASPLVEAARDSDAKSVELCLAAGLGASPGVALHAAYEGLPELALRLLRSEPVGEAALPEVRTPPAVPSTGVPDDAVWVAGLLAFVAGEIDETTGAAVGTWRLWEQAWHRTSDVAGPTYHAPDSCYHGYAEADFADGKLVERRTYLSSRTLYRVKRYRPDGELLLEREYDSGVPESEREWPADGITIHRRFHGDGAVRVERTERDDVLVAEHWYDVDGNRVVDVTPTDATVEKAAVERWRALDPSGAVVAEGHVKPGILGRPVGHWRLFGFDGAELGTVSFGGLDLVRHEDLGLSAHAVHVWRSAPTPTELAGVEAVEWDQLDTFFGSPSEVPFLLKGLAVVNPKAFFLPLGNLSARLHHQHTIAGATGPAFRYMTALPGRVDGDDARARLLEFLAAIATRDGDLGAAHQLKLIQAHLPADATEPGEFFSQNGAESAYHEVFSALADAVPTWTGLAAHHSAEIRRWAVVLLAAAPGEAAARALRDRLTAESEREIRAEIMLGLALHEAGTDTRRTLEQHLTDDDPLQRFCAALTWVRKQNSPADAGAQVLIEALRGNLDTDGFASLYLGAGDPKTDAATTLALLPLEQAETLLSGLCATLDEVHSVDAVSVANTLLDIVFPTEAYGEGEPLTDAQRTVIRAIADNPHTGEFNVDLNEVLRRNGLPCSADELRALADTAPASESAGVQ